MGIRLRLPIGFRRLCNALFRSFLQVSMNIQRSILLVACLSITACAGPFQQHSTRDASLAEAQFTVQVVEASGGA